MQDRRKLRNCVLKTKGQGDFVAAASQSVAAILLERLPIGPDFDRQIDEETIPLQMCLLANVTLAKFKKPDLLCPESVRLVPW